jgi:hypothetical protein
MSAPLPQRWPLYFNLPRASVLLSDVTLHVFGTIENDALASTKRVHFQGLWVEEASRPRLSSDPQLGNLRRSAEVGGTPKDDAAGRE